MTRFAALFVLLQGSVVNVAAAAEWPKSSFETLLPAAPEGFASETLRIEELPTFAQKSGLEGMGNTTGAISGFESQAPSVRYRITRKYVGATGAAVEGMVDSEDMELASVILLVHGKRLGRDGAWVPLRAKDVKAGEALRAQGVTPFEHGGHLGVRVKAPGGHLSVLLFLKTTTAGFACEYEKCKADVQRFVESMPMKQLESFSRYNHRKAKEAD